MERAKKKKKRGRRWADPRRRYVKHNTGGKRQWIRRGGLLSGKALRRVASKGSVGEKAGKGPTLVYNRGWASQ